LGIEQKIKIRHPYKYKKIESTFEDNYPNVNINIEVKASIDRTYDIVEIHK